MDNININQTRPKVIPVISVLMVLFSLSLTFFDWLKLFQNLHIVSTSVSLPGKFELPFSGVSPIANILIFGIPPIIASVGLWKMTKWGYSITIFAAAIWIVGALYFASRILLGYEEMDYSVVIMALNFIFMIIVIFYTWQNREYFV